MRVGRAVPGHWMFAIRGGLRIACPSGCTSNDEPGADDRRIPSGLPMPCLAAIDMTAARHGHTSRSGADF
jgi:hypothetical protein